MVGKGLTAVLLNPYTLMDSSFWFDKIEMIHCIYQGVTDSQVIISKYNCIPFSEDLFVLANSVDLEEMPHYVPFHLGLHCLPSVQ